MAMALQEIFDKAAAHLMKQGRRSRGVVDVDGGELCISGRQWSYVCCRGIYSRRSLLPQP